MNAIAQSVAIIILYIEFTYGYIYYYKNTSSKKNDDVTTRVGANMTHSYFDVYFEAVKYILKLSIIRKSIKCYYTNHF